MPDLIYEYDRIYCVDEDNELIAEITFPAKNGVAVIDHTFVDGSLRGQGVAGMLVRAAADKITADGNRIAAVCSYAKKWFEKHPEYDTVSPQEMQ